ncbi:hypothetical protein N7466_000494 [Penicillium verhagenii]|uniref:uncharacterized protein n=1 Tax=Penicillium verhagenii TaxID=1562060 RepID=UPI00254510C9|nr:uncharacterized protein N7466_000494 [Penicillium verhagenii]KAJ5947479.1 hypothetical protein N7466_000494 [Penicillium verhagenii]
MVTRRSHKKSRNGCTKCKERHIKCDEGVPKCENCVSRRLQCLYVPVRPGGGEPSAGYAGTSPEANHSPAPADSDGNGMLLNKRLVETKLLHHYYTNTCLTIGTDEHSLAVWQVSLPELATSNEHVLESLLAFTALHLAYLEPNRRLGWTNLALEYSSKAYSGLANIISRLSPSTAPSAFACSVFILLSSMAQHGALGITTGPTYLSEALRLKKLIHGCEAFYRAVQFFGVQERVVSYNPEQNKNLQHENQVLRATIHRYA